MNKQLSILKYWAEQSAVASLRDTKTKNKLLFVGCEGWNQESQPEAADASVSLGRRQQGEEAVARLVVVFMLSGDSPHRHHWCSVDVLMIFWAVLIAGCRAFLPWANHKHMPVWDYFTLKKFSIAPLNLTSLWRCRSCDGCDWLKTFSLICPQEILFCLFSSSVVDSHSSLLQDQWDLWLAGMPKDTFGLDWTQSTFFSEGRRGKKNLNPPVKTHTHTHGDTHSEECVFRSVWTIELKWFHRRSGCFRTSAFHEQQRRIKPGHSNILKLWILHFPWCTWSSVFRWVRQCLDDNVDVMTPW